MRNSILADMHNDWEIVCDFDGTITPCDVTDAILERFADKEWEAVEDAWNKGRITARECMERQVRLVRATPEEMDAFLDTVPLVAGFAEFAEYCRSEKLSLLVVSDGLDHAIRRILDNHGLGFLPVVSNRLRFAGGSSWRLEFPYGARGCSSGVCKCTVAKSACSPVLLIGDGRSDCCVAGEATLVLAKEGMALERTCMDNGYPYLSFSDFHDVHSLLKHGTGRPFAERAPIAHVAR